MKTIYTKICPNCLQPFDTPSKKRKFHNSACSYEFMAKNKIGFHALNNGRKDFFIHD